MMDNWRRQTGDNNGGFEDSRRRSMRKKPPRGVNNWQPTVPNWEKRFCKVVGDMDWETLLDKKRFVHLYENVIKWNDSAGEEAFYNAKKRFLAQMNGWPCEIPLPSPDLYIDKVDWNAQVDLDPLLELEYDESSVPKEHHEPVVIFGDTLISNLGLSPAGWGDEDEKFKKAVNSSWDNYHEQMPSQIKETVFENDYYVESDHHKANAGDTGWDDNWLKMEGTGKNDAPGTWQVNNSWENKNYGQQYKPRNESSRFVDTGWDDDWLKMEGTAGNSNVPGTGTGTGTGTWQVNGNTWENKNSGRRYESSRYMDSNNYYNKGRYKWRSGNNNGKREAIVN